MYALVDYLERSISKYNANNKFVAVSRFSRVIDFIAYLRDTRWSEQELDTIQDLIKYYEAMDWIAIIEDNNKEWEEKKEFINNWDERTWLWDELYYCYHKGKWSQKFIDCINRLWDEEKDAYICSLEIKIDFLTSKRIDYSSMDYKEYLQTDYRKDLSKQCKEEAGNKCQLCNSEKNLNTHHRSYRRRWLPWEKDDLIVLCNKCHSKFHNK